MDDSYSKDVVSFQHYVHTNFHNVIPFDCHAEIFLLVPPSLILILCSEFS